MRMRALLIALAICALAAGAAGVAKVLELRSKTAAPSPKAYVQAAWAVYRWAPGHRVHVDEQSLDCMSCHEPRKDGGFDRPAPTKCVGCHEDRSQIRHALINVDEGGHRLHTADAARTPDGHEANAVTDCVACHGFGPDPDKRADACLACHEHTRGEVPPIVTHAEVACKNCHEVHDNMIAPLNCAECHAIEAEHGHASLSPQQNCLTCHRAHDRAAPAASGCVTCHGDSEVRANEATPALAPKVPKSATFAGGHSDCASCHAPHSFTKDTAVACTNCHTNVHALEGKGHRECSACHTPHAVRESVAQNVCLNCHKDVALQHSTKLEPQVACTSCHDAHPSRAENRTAHTAQGTCTNCHRDIGQAGAHAHKGAMACVTCHQPHAFALADDQSACASCHARELTLTKANPGHATCTGCHQDLPHGAKLDAKSCTSCHSEVHAKQGHSTCTNCHEPHRGAQNGQSCSDCHAPEAKASIHAIKEVQCVQCHDKHTTELAPGVAQCASCHDRKELAGRHDVPAHAANCTTCHAPHSTALPGARETCLQCHQDRKDHQPEAKRCEGCHQFVPAASGRKGGL
jgi:predicted CXXCH cytochrome family protein